jgi:hypothetical protein
VTGLGDVRCMSGTRTGRAGAGQWDGQGPGEEDCEGQGRGGKRGARGVVAGLSQLFVNFRVQNLTPRPASTVWTYTSISKKSFLEN